MESCDVLIVGGGPAGSTCARKLVQAGLDVLVMDKAAFPRDKTCAGWITPATVSALDLDTAEYATGRVLQPISRFITGVIGGESVEVNCGGVVSHGIRRREFDDYLLARSRARLLLGTPLRAIKRERDSWIINESIRSPMIVGAGGHFCPVARFLDPGGGQPEPCVAAQEVEYELNARQQAECLIDGERPELYFCTDLQGYGWAFHKGGCLNVGLGRLDHRHVAEHVMAFRDWLVALGRIPSDAPATFRGHAYLLRSQSTRPAVADGALLIGDAAGLAFSQSGEGILPAIESGLLAADAILAASGDYAVGRLMPYADRLDSRFGRSGEPGVSRPPAMVGDFKRSASHWLLKQHWFARHVVIDRWFLHAKRQPLPLRA